MLISLQGTFTLYSPPPAINLSFSTVILETTICRTINPKTPVDIATAVSDGLPSDCTAKKNIITEINTISAADDFQLNHPLEKYLEDSPFLAIFPSLCFLSYSLLPSVLLFFFLYFLHFSIFFSLFLFFFFPLFSFF